MLRILLIIVIIYTYILRKKILQDKKKFLYYRDIPTNDSPALVGKIIKGHTDGNDIIATILDLTYRGYIRFATEEIKGKEKSVLYLEKSLQTTELKEYEMFLINQIFKGNYRVIFEDYITSSKFKQDFQAFDKMLERRQERKTIYRNSLLKNINKILLLVSYLMFGISIFYSIILPISLIINNIIKFDNEKIIIINLIISSIIYLIVAYKYITYIGKSTNARENINLNITYIILSIVLGIFVIFNSYNNIFNLFLEEFILYKIITNAIIAITTVLYMFNIIKHTEKEEYLYYVFIIISLFAIILNIKLTMANIILFFMVYIFFKIPKHNILKEEDYITKWMSFKKYLEDYSMLSEQESNAILIWEKYLIYAISLGVNKKIIKKYASLNNIKLLSEKYLKKVYVEYFE